MRSSKLRLFTQHLTLAITLLLATCVGISAQGKGHGNGHGNGGEHGNGGGNQGDHGNRGGGMPPGQAKKQERIAQQPYQPQQVIVERRADNGNWRQQRQQQQVYRQPQVIVPVWNNGGYKNYGQQRAAEVHARNAERKAEHDLWRNDERMDRQRYSQTYSYSQPYVYTQPYSYSYQQPYVYNQYPYQRESAKAAIIRSIIGMVLGNNNSYYSQPSYSYNQPYSPRYNGGYYTSYPQYQSWAYAPSYDPYQSTVYYDSNYGDPYYSGGYSNNLGMPIISALSSRGGFVGRLVSQILATAYEQGYRDAAYARSSRAYYVPDPYTGQIAYTDPSYEYPNIGYDPYSSLDADRQAFSQGYELGYRDGLNTGRNEQAAYTNFGGGDLVSTLLANVVRVRV